MMFPGLNPHLFRWRSPSENKTPASKIHEKNGDVDQWRKRVEMASEFAVSEVFSQKKPHSGTHSLSMPLNSSEQLRDHDDAYSEAQALLGDWLNSKLRLELEMDDEDDPMDSAGRRSPVASASAQPAVLKYDKFDELYNCLAEEEEQSAVSSVLQDLMEQEVLDSGLMEELALDVGQTRKKFRNPVVTMDARHLQVRENRARREAERQRQQREKEVQHGAREEAKRKEREKEMRRKQEERRQEEMVQQEMVRLRRQMEERRGLEQMVRQRERQRAEGQGATRRLQSAPPLPTKQQLQDTEQLYKQEKIQAKVQMHDLKCLQKHFSRWYAVVLDQRLRLGKATALCNWKRQLRAWRAWRAVVWTQRRQREVARTEEELRTENRQQQLASESYQRRLLRRCLNEWQRWCWTEKEQRELLAQQQEIRHKMAALINAASTGRLRAAETPKYQQIMASPEAVSVEPERTNKEDHHRSGTFTPDSSAVQQRTVSVGTETQPTQPRQVTRQHAAPTVAELHKVQQRQERDGILALKVTTTPDSRLEKRHTVQQQIITQQRKLLREQQEQIARLKEEQSMVNLELQMEKAAQLTQLSVLQGQRAKSHETDPTGRRAQRAPAEPGLGAPWRKAVTRQKCQHPIITAMEERACQRAERRKEIQELKRKKEEDKLAEMKAAEEQRQREEEEEKRRAAERKKEEKRQEKAREEEKQRQLKRQQELLKLARQHYHRNLLLRQGLAPWRRLIQLGQANIQLADSRHHLSLLRRCTQGWLQSARESMFEKEASADQLYQHFLLQRSLSHWKRLKDWRLIQEERAERFYRTRTLKRFLLALLGHVTQERLLEWDRQELSREHNNRQVLRRCFLVWRQLPCLLRKEREKEARRERLGRKVAEVLSDFCSHPT